MKNKIIALFTLFACCLTIGFAWNYFIQENSNTNQNPVQNHLSNNENSPNDEQIYLDPNDMKQAREIIETHDTIDEKTKQQLYELNLSDQDIEMLVQIKNMDNQPQSKQSAFTISPILLSLLLFFVILIAYFFYSRFLKH